MSTSAKSKTSKASSRDSASISSNVTDVYDETKSPPRESPPDPVLPPKDSPSDEGQERTYASVAQGLYANQEPDDEDKVHKNVTAGRGSHDPQDLDVDTTLFHDVSFSYPVVGRDVRILDDGRVVSINANGDPTSNPDRMTAPARNLLETYQTPRRDMILSPRSPIFEDDVDGLLMEPPTDRHVNVLRQDALRQSISGGGARTAYKPRLDPSDQEMTRKRRDDRQKATAAPKGNAVMLNGDIITVRPDKRSDVGIIKRWDKTRRSTLPEDVLQLFNQNATKRILDTKYRLKQHAISQDNSKFLTQIKYANTQLRRLEAHMIMYDFEDVLTVVVPVNVQYSPRIETKTYHVILDHCHLTPQLVANSIVWHKLWAAPDYKLENLGLVFSFFESNTDPALWEKCLEAYDEFDALERGGPLMVYLVLDRIQRRTEDVLKTVQDVFKAIKIKDIPGENIDEVTTLSKTTYNILEGASTSNRNYLPDNFSELLLDILQTSSVKQFNAVFSDLKRTYKTEAALQRRQVEYPDLNQLTSLAEQTYLDLCKSQHWVKTPSRARQAAGLTATETSDSKKNKNGWKCILCGSEYHLWKHCPKVTSPTAKQLDEGRAKWGSKRMRLPQKHVDPDGKPRIRSKKGFYVLDTKAWVAIKSKNKESKDKDATPPAASVSTDGDDASTSSPSTNLAVDANATSTNTSDSPSVTLEPQPDGSISMRAAALRTLLGGGST